MSGPGGGAIDAHVHVWRLRDPYGVPIRDRLEALARDFSLDDLAPHWNRLGVRRCVLVEASGDPAETHRLLDIACAHPDRVAGVVGWVDLAAHDAGEQLRSAAARGLLGIREIAAFGERAGRLSSPAVGRRLGLLQEQDLCLEVVVRPEQLGLVERIAASHPRLRINVNHGGRPVVLAGWSPGWADAIRRVARLPNVSCKLSGLIERAGFEWTADDLRPWVAELLRAFGAGRLPFASNWPVMTVAGTYPAWWDAVQATLDALGTSEADRESVFGGAARAFYRLGPTQAASGRAPDAINPPSTGNTTPLT